MTYPRIHLAVDNCFASKRWTRPAEWARVIREELGLECVEASADNECDPLYAPQDYLADWREQVARAQATTGIRVVNLYSGHGTYATLGLGHPDERIRTHILERWVRPMLDTAGALGAGLGFFAHAFDQATLGDRTQYGTAYADLVGMFSDIAAYAASRGVATVAVEQMYSPHQVPWTIGGAERLLSDVAASGDRAPFYVTIDTGHQCAQRRYPWPTYGMLKEWARGDAHHRVGRAPWLGPSSVRALVEQACATGGAAQDALLRQALEEAARYPHMFASYEDGDPYVWLERLGCYSPIIHLQQTDGASSSHRAFTVEHNRNGIIDPPHVLHALACACERSRQLTMPPPCEDIYLTLEVFSGTADTPDEILARMRESAAYWRRWVPHDGIRLDNLIDKKEREHARTAA
ncbi:MAG: hypothetical protein GF331_00855 [Chitinivibrionales bacterium]|nr:hypothetical protein [Chitinivibrionales bacterium]